MMPARVEPVNDTMSTSGCPAITCPTSGPVPLIMLYTPFGTPAASMISEKTMPLTGAISLGFSTTVQPAAIAGATLHTIWLSGQFHGVMRAQTPIGSRTMRVSPRISEKAKSSSPLIVASRCACPAQACASRAQVIGAPISWLTAWAMSS